MEDDEGADGPRALTRAILKNKGLTPKRAKSVRNPRVKKRLRYEKAQKRVASQRAVERSEARLVDIGKVLHTSQCLTQEFVGLYRDEYSKRHQAESTLTQWERHCSCWWKYRCRGRCCQKASVT